MKISKAIILILVLSAYFILNPGIENKEASIQKLFNSAKQSIEKGDYASASTNYTKLKDKYKNEKQSTEIYKLVLTKVDQKIEPLIKGKKYDETIKLLQNAADEFSPASEYFLSQADDFKRLNNSVIAYHDANDLYKNKNYLAALNKYQEVIKENENYNDAKEKISKLKDIVFRQYLSKSQKSFLNKEYTNALKQIDVAFKIKPNDLKTRSLQIKYSKAKSDYDKKQLAIAVAKALKDKMQTYEFDVGNIGIACSIKVTRSFDAGYTNYTAAKDHIFLWVGINACNKGDDSEPVNPNDFTLSTLDGYTVNPDTNTTYSMNNYFDAINLPPKGQSQGWLIFHITKADQYILNYRGFGSAVTKILTTL